MTFEEIFNEEGLYTTKDHVKGFCFEIYNVGGHSKALVGVQYRDEKDIDPSKNIHGCYNHLFKSEYSKVLNIKQLFTNRID